MSRDPSSDVELGREWEMDSMLDEEKFGDTRDANILQYVNYSRLALWSTVVTFTALAIILCVYLSIFGHTLSLALSALLAFGICSILSWTGFKIKKKKTAGSSINDLRDESDPVEARHVRILAGSVLVMCAFYGSIMAGTYSDAHKLSESNTFGPNFLYLSIQFSAIVLYLSHRILRPADRMDPLRTILDLEAVDVCLNALDSADLYGTYSLGEKLPQALHSAVQITIVLWLVTAGLQLAGMLYIHLPLGTWLWEKVNPKNEITDSFEGDWALNTVKRTKVASTVRYCILVRVLPVETLALAVRIAIYHYAGIDTQGTFIIKNVAGIWRVFSAWRTNDPLYSEKGRIATFLEDCGLAVLECLKCCATSAADCIKWWIALVRINCCRSSSSEVLREESSDDTGFTTREKILTIVAFMLYLATSVGYGYLIYLSGKFSHFPIFALDAIATVRFFMNLRHGNFLAVSTGWAFIDLYSAFWMCGMSAVLRVPYMYDLVNDLSSDIQFYSYILVAAHISPVACFVFAYVRTNDLCLSLLRDSNLSEMCFVALAGADLYMIAITSFPDDEYMSVIVAVFGGAEICEAVWTGICMAMLGRGGSFSPERLQDLQSSSRAVKMFVDVPVFILRIVLFTKFGILPSVFIMKSVFNLLHTVVVIMRMPQRRKKIRLGTTRGNVIYNDREIEVDTEFINYRSIFKELSGGETNALR